jgi:small subunit ribosomal protein S8
MYIDLLIQLKNAQAARKEWIKLPYSNLGLAIFELLLRYGFVSSVQKKGRMPKRIIEVHLKYADKEGKIRGIKIVTKPSVKVYKGYRELRPVRQGYGISVVSTSEGLMTGDEARKKKVGGQVLFEIW